MPRSITFILPTLFDRQCRHFLDSSSLLSMEQLSGRLIKSKKQSIGDLHQWLIKHYKLPTEYANSANLMAQGRGLARIDDDKDCHWLRADPVMLSVTHNAIYCRGNRVLNLNQLERDSIELLVNDYFKDQSIELILCDSNRGYLKYTGQVGCQFMSLAEVMGQDISQRLPRGENATFWHRLMTDLQLLLHNCEVNKERLNQGEPLISGFWLWAETESNKIIDQQDRQQSIIYSDDAALSGSLDYHLTLQQLDAQFDVNNEDNSSLVIHVSEFQEASSQSDDKGWLTLYQKWVVDWLLPAIESVNNTKLQQIILLPDDGFSYQYDARSKWCFWRNHSTVQMNKEESFKEL